MPATYLRQSTNLPYYAESQLADFSQLSVPRLENTLKLSFTFEEEEEEEGC